jgi:sporulation integral membrane protein YlbJ
MYKRKTNYNFRKINLKNLIVTTILLFIMFQIIKDPKQSILSAGEGLNLWFNLLLPSLFPFIFISDLLISFGFIDFISKYLEPIMKPVFNVSGIGIFPFSMSMLSGYPVGARLTSKIRELNLITQDEGNRLISFSSTSGPLFILGTVLIGMVGAPKLSSLMIIPHYLSALTIGILFRNYRKNSKNTLGNISSSKTNSNAFISKKNNKSLGSIISGSIKDSMDSIIVIGGFLIIYSVIIDIVLSSALFNFIISGISAAFSIEINTLKGIAAGIIELTKGCSLVSKLDIDIIIKILLLNFLIGWGGLSIHSQAISFISRTDISTKIYLISKFLHGLLSALYTYAIYILFYKGQIETTFNPKSLINNPSINSWLYLITSSTKLVVSLIVFLSILSILLYQIRKELSRSL